MTTNKQQHVHFIGICGVAMSALALAFKKNGREKLPDGRLAPSWHVTGSDVGFYPPVSTHLKDAGVDYYAGWHVDKMIADGVPDLIVVGNVAGSRNPEWLYVQDQKLNYKSYPEVIAEHFIKKNSVVCAGTYGKTTSTALLTWILKEAGYDPSYMFGGLSLNGEPTPPATPLPGGNTNPPSQGGHGGVLAMPSAAMTSSAWSVVEGDEYKASRWDNGPKFAYYSPTHLLLTSVVWDHADVYPTEKKYIEVFKKLVASVPTNGLKIISEKALPIIEPTPPATPLPGGNTNPPPRGGSRGGLANTITYGKNTANDYMYTKIVQSKNGINFTITDKISNEKLRGNLVALRNIQYPIFSSCLGDYMADNITGCFALARQIGIAPDKIIAAIKSFKSLKRRLEKRLDGPVTIFDDIAHSPSKAEAILETLKKVYSRPLPALSSAEARGGTSSPSQRGGQEERSRASHIYAIFEPNTGNRQREAIPAYANAFAGADEIIIPRLTKIKTNPDEKTLPLEGDELTKIISKTHPAATYIDDDEKLIEYLRQKIQPNDVVVFMGSHGFRGMIEKLVDRTKY